MDGMYNKGLDREAIKHLQEVLCRTIGFYAYCVDSVGMPVTEISGKPEETAKLMELVDSEKRQELFQRISDSTLEDQAIEDTGTECVKYGAVCVRANGKPVITWIVFVVLSDTQNEEEEEFAAQFSYRLPEKKIGDILDLIRENSALFMENQITLSAAQMETIRNRFSKEEMEYSLKRTATMTEIVQLLDCDEPIEEIMRRILHSVSSFLEIDEAYLCSIASDKADTMDIISKWQAENVVSSFDLSKNQYRPSYLFGKKTVVLSTDGDHGKCDGDMKEAGVTAVVALPISLKGRISMYACFTQRETARTWEISEIKFLNDAVKVLQSILTRRIQKNSLASSYAALEEVLDNVGSDIYVRDRESGQLLFVNRSFRNTFRKETDENLLAELFEARIPDNREEGSLELYMEEKGNWYDLFYKIITWVDDRKVLMCSIYDITEKKMYQHKIERQAYTDFLTGLYNRLCCERDLAKYVDTAKTTNCEGAVLYMDLDDFKHINDSLGHQYGDVLLKSIAHGMQSVPGIRNFCYRMGGDEFVIIVPPEQYHQFDEIVEGVKMVFNKPWFLKDADYYCTMSMGIVHFPAQGDETQDLIKKADIAMYEAKKSGKNRVATYSYHIKSDSNKRLDLEKNLREAALDGCKEFEVFYQPIIDIQNRNVCAGAEALIRWNSGEMGFMSPVDFIPLAEYLGLINPIGTHVLKQACKTCKGWNDHGHPEYKVNVNLSVVQLLQPDIVEIVEDTLKETRLNPRNLVLEVTEGLAINDLNRMKKILAQIKSLGVRIALDDFGTGYSSLSHIRELPFDVIKVDQTFVKDLAEDTYSKSFIRMVSDLADAIGVSVCVEGIETMQQFKVLEGMKVHMIQGYYFGKPMTQKDFEGKYINMQNSENKTKS